MKITDMVYSIITKTNTNTSNASSHIGLSGITAYHLLQGNLAVDNTVTTQGFNTTPYTSSSATTNIDMSTQWGNDASEQFGGLVWLKDRVEATNNFLYDTIRGATKEINSNTTEAEATLAGGLTAFNSTGFTVGADAGHNSTTNNMVSWNFQTARRVSGTTNHGKAYTCHFNPFTGFTIVKYEGSGIAGHEIPHHLGRKLGFVTTKDLVAVENWYASNFDSAGAMALNATGKLGEIYGQVFSSTEISITTSTTGITNNSGHQHIMYGWANSYIDGSNKLIGNFLTTVDGNGILRLSVHTSASQSEVMLQIAKPTLTTGDWDIVDYARGNTKELNANLTAAESTITANSLITTASPAIYHRATDTTNLQVQNAIIPFATGIDSNGTKITTLSKNETFSGVAFTAGKNYPYYDNTGARGKSTVAPNYDVINPANGGDFYNVITKKWYTSAGTEITTSRNYMNTIVYADNDGSPLYVEELPKTVYVDKMQVDGLNVLRKFNLNQTWQNMAASRVAGVTYTNTTGKPIVVQLAVGTVNRGLKAITLTVDGKDSWTHRNDATTYIGDTLTAIVPNGSSYILTGTNVTWNSSAYLSRWSELR